MSRVINAVIIVLMEIIDSLAFRHWVAGFLLIAAAAGPSSAYQTTNVENIPLLLDDLNCK